MIPDSIAWLVLPFLLAVTALLLLGNRPRPVPARVVRRADSTIGHRARSWDSDPDSFR